jgi:hypothetical protein
MKGPYFGDLQLTRRPATQDLNIILKEDLRIYQSMDKENGGMCSRQQGLPGSRQALISVIFSIINVSNMIFFLLLPHLVYTRECGFTSLKAAGLGKMRAIP